MLPGGTCSKCLTRRLTAAGMPKEQVGKVVRSRQREAGIEHDDGPGISPCEAAPRIIARIARDAAAQDNVSDLVRPVAIGADGAQIARQLDSGVKLDPGLRREMSDSFRADFSGVRIHDGPGAARIARQLNARAITIGSHIIFAERAFSPNTREGRRLLRHELVHVIQQGQVSAIPSGVLRIAAPGERSEREAAAVAERMGPGPVGLSLSRVPGVQINRTSLCEIACDAVAWGATAALAAAVAVGCTAGSVVTVGTLAIPCTAAIIAAAAMAAADAVIWAALLKDAICGIPITARTPTAQASPPAAGEGESAMA